MRKLRHFSKCKKVRKSGYFTKIRQCALIASFHWHNDRCYLQQNHGNWFISVQSDQASTPFQSSKQKSVLFCHPFPGTFHPSAKSAWQKSVLYFRTFPGTFLLSTKSSWQMSVLYFRTFPSTFHFFTKIAWKKVSSTSAPFQALFIFSQKVPGKKCPLLLHLFRHF